MLLLRTIRLRQDVGARVEQILEGEEVSELSKESEREQDHDRRGRGGAVARGRGMRGVLHVVLAREAGRAERRAHQVVTTA